MFIILVVDDCGMIILMLQHPTIDVTAIIACITFLCGFLKVFLFGGVWDWVIIQSSVCLSV